MERVASTRFPSFKCDCKKVLVVDDNQFNIMAAFACLSSGADLTPDTACNGQDAYDKIIASYKRECCQQPYKVVLMDLEMPIMDGLTATK